MQTPPLNAFEEYQIKIKASFEEFKKKHNQIAESLDKIEKAQSTLNLEIAEIKEFLTFTNKRYRKFYHKKHLKNKFN